MLQLTDRVPSFLRECCARNKVITDVVMKDINFEQNFRHFLKLPASRYPRERERGYLKRLIYSTMIARKVLINRVLRRGYT